MSATSLPEYRLKEYSNWLKKSKFHRRFFFRVSVEDPPREEGPRKCYEANLVAWLEKFMKLFTHWCLPAGCDHVEVYVADLTHVAVDVPVPPLLLPVMVLGMESFYQDPKNRTVEEGGSAPSLLDSNTRYRELLAEMDFLEKNWVNTESMLKKQIEAAEHFLQINGAMLSGSFAHQNIANNTASLQKERALHEEKSREMAARKKEMEAQIAMLETVKVFRPLWYKKGFPEHPLDLRMLRYDPYEDRFVDRVLSPAPAGAQADLRSRGEDVRSCTEASVMILCHVHGMSTICTPSFPGGSTNLPINLLNNSYLDSKTVLASLVFDPPDEDSLVQELEKAMRTFNSFLFQCVDGVPMFGVKKVCKEGPFFDVKKLESVKSEFAELKWHPPIRRRCINLIEYWSGWKDRNRVSKMYFRPWPANLRHPLFEDTIVNGMSGINMYMGFKYPLCHLAHCYLKTDKSVLSDFKKLVFNNLCGGEEECYVYLMKWMARLLQFPFSKMYTAVVLPGGQGIAKTFFVGVVGECLGQYFYKANADDAGKRFNHAYANRLLIFMDEHVMSQDKEYAKIKTMITDSNQATEQKFQEEKTYENYANLVFAMNPTKFFSDKGTSGGMDQDDRRFFVSSCVSHLSHDLKKRTQETVVAMARDPAKKEMLAFCYELMMTDVSDFDPRIYPITEKCKINKMGSDSTFITSWIYERLKEHTLVPSATADFLSWSSEQVISSGGSGDAASSPSVQWNPLRLQGESLWKWKDFCTKNASKYMIYNEWTLVKRLLSEQKKFDRVLVSAIKEEEMETYWNKPFWLQAVPLDKVVDACDRWVHCQFGKHIDRHMFVTHLKSALPCFAVRKEEMNMAGTSKTVEILYLPGQAEVLEWFKTNYKELTTEADIRWTTAGEWKEPPRIQVYSLQCHLTVGKKFRAMSERDPVLKPYSEFVLDKFSKTDYTMVPEKKLRKLWIPDRIDPGKMQMSDQLQDTASRQKGKRLRLVKEGDGEIDPDADEDDGPALAKAKLDLVDKEIAIRRKQEKIDELYDRVESLEKELEKTRNELSASKDSTEIPTSTPRPPVVASPLLGPDKGTPPTIEMILSQPEPPGDDLLDTMAPQQMDLGSPHLGLEDLIEDLC